MLDVACLLVFAGIGRASHEEGITVGGVLWTLCPFLLGAALAWVVMNWAGADLGTVRAGVVVWVCTVVVGMLARRAVGEGTATAFVIVAMVFLGVTLLGWRLVAARLDSRVRSLPTAR